MLVIKPLIIMYAKMSRAIYPRDIVYESKKVYAVCKRRAICGTERAILWNIGILKVHFVHVRVHVYSKGDMNKEEFHKNNIQPADVDSLVDSPIRIPINPL